MEKLRAQEDLELPGEIETEGLEGGREGGRQETRTVTFWVVRGRVEDHQRDEPRGFCCL